MSFAREWSEQQVQSFAHEVKAVSNAVKDLQATIRLTKTESKQ